MKVLKQKVKNFAKKIYKGKKFRKKIFQNESRSRKDKETTP